MSQKKNEKLSERTEAGLGLGELELAIAVGRIPQLLAVIRELGIVLQTGVEENGSVTKLPNVENIRHLKTSPERHIGNEKGQKKKKIEKKRKVENRALVSSISKFKCEF